MYYGQHSRLWLYLAILRTHDVYQYDYEPGFLLCKYVDDHETELMTSCSCHIHPAFISYRQLNIVYVKVRSHMTYCPIFKFLKEKYYLFHPSHECTDYCK